jgi:hypothetical protein
LSCNKDSEDNGSEANIKYKIANSDMKITSVISFYTYENCGRYPIPFDSTTSMTIDVDGDSNNDFKLSASHHICGNTHCYYFIYVVRLESINNYDFIRVDNLNNNQPEKMDSTVDISKKGLWKETVTLELDSRCPMPYENFLLNDSYIGFMINNKYGWIHVSPYGGNGVKIIDYAINLTENSSIRQGQKE